MKKIPTLFVREFDGHKIKSIKPELTDEKFRWVLDGEGDATVKVDGACCAIIDGVFYKRYDAKPGKKPPENAIPCCDPDPVTGHWPHWVPVKVSEPADKWFLQAIWNYCKIDNNGMRLDDIKDGTYEAIGEHFNGNPYDMDIDTLIPHGRHFVDVERTFEGIKAFLTEHEIEGIVFWKDGEPQCKIKRTDFGLEWPVKGEEE